VTGRVIAFDADAGFGTIEASDGREFFFHCTKIADGSREIAVGANVRFDVVAGHLGRWEASRVEKH
jgi:cold shock CspA family protein